MTFELDIPAVRRCAGAIRDLGGRVAAGATWPPATESAPRWAAADQADLLTDSTMREMTASGHAVLDAGGRVDAAVADHLAADERAARRLRRAA